MDNESDLSAMGACGVVCYDDPDCDDDQYCNGAETCVDGSCQPGTPIDCNDDVACTVDSCNEETDSYDHTPDDAACDNGVYCDGAETCTAQLGCQPGADPYLGQVCDEDNDQCIECLPKHSPCAEDWECCSGKCRGKAGGKMCR